MWIYFPISLACNCNTKGSTSCAKIGGYCECSSGYSGKDCNTCKDQYYQSDKENGKLTCTGIWLIDLIKIVWIINFFLYSFHDA